MHTYTPPFPLPGRLAAILSADTVAHGATLETLSEFQTWLSQNRLVFFPEYTDHGIRHVEWVLTTACSLVTDVSWEAITPADCKALTLAVLLHDCGMHLAEDAFKELITSYQSNNSYFQDRPWGELWDDYLAEAAHFDGRTLRAILGDETPIRRPSSDHLDWSERDKRLIGEFIRRHHARLAHDIALSGVPASSATSLSLHRFDRDEADLIGLIARSHGMSLRHAIDLLRAHLNQSAREYRKIHAPFIMALLRVADYFQVQSERAPETVLEITRLRSPVSQTEWDTHKCIRSITATTDDPECLHVSARPEELRTYRNVRGLLASLQNELDQSWAALGEVYGLQRQGLNKLGMQIRRVRSNLDDEHTFRQSVNYVPRIGAFEVSEADLLPMLVAPLYGNTKEIGIRELLQNSIDAIRERQAYCARHTIPFPNHNAADVRISLEVDNAGRRCLVISDCGIGMTEEVIFDYFLRIGASFRRSHTWQREFEPEPGKPQIVRVGRFGVGVLAAFLLGDEISVVTRHVLASETEALTFVARVDDEEIEVKKTSTGEVGTTIRINITAEVYKQLTDFGCVEWDWYRLGSPSVERLRNGAPISQALRRIPEGNDLPDYWHALEDPNLGRILWTHAKTSKIVINGFNIGHTASSQGLRRKLWWDGGRNDDDTMKPVAVPSVSIEDRDGHLALNLQRSDLVETRYPFAEDLLKDVARDFVAFNLVFAPTKLGYGDVDFSQKDYPGLEPEMTFGMTPVSQWYWTADGAGYHHWIGLRRQSFKMAKVALATGPIAFVPTPNAHEVVLLGTLNLAQHPTHVLPLALAQVLGVLTSEAHPFRSFFNRCKSAAVIVPEHYIPISFTPIPQHDFTGVRRRYVNIPTGRIGIMTSRVDTPTEVNGRIATEVEHRRLIYAEMNDPYVECNIENAFTLEYERLMPQDIIPYDLNTRRGVFSAQFAELSDYITRWERIATRSQEERDAIFLGKGTKETMRC